MLRPALVLVAATAVLGCSETDAGTMLRASLVEELRIDGHAHTLVPLAYLPDGLPAYRPDGAVASSPEGTIAVLQKQSRQVLLFDRAGRLISTFGQEGEGPGEFRSISRIGWLADSLWLHDATLGRITLLSPTLELARTLPISRAARPAPSDVGRIPGNELTGFFGLQPDGSTIKLVSIGSDLEVPEEFRGFDFFARVDPQDYITKVIALVPRGPASSGPSPRPIHSISPDGRLVGYATASINENGAPVYDVSIITVEGDTVFSRQYVPEGVTGGYEFPLLGLTIGSDETVWLQLPNKEGTRPHLVLDSSGEPIGMVEIPGRSRIAEVSEQAITVIEWDEFDVESVVLYQLAWQP